MAIKDIRDFDPTLTDDDIKVLKHLNAIDNLFKKGNLSIRQLFTDNGTMIVTKEYDGIEYEISSFCSIICDGGDPDRSGEFGIHQVREWIDLMNEKYL